MRHQRRTARPGAGAEPTPDKGLLILSLDSPVAPTYAPPTQTPLPPTTTPEPATALLVGGGLGALALGARRRRVPARAARSASGA